MMWIMSAFLYLWPRHRPAVRELIAETLIGWALRIAPPGEFRTGLARYVVAAWDGHPLNNHRAYVTKALARKAER